MVLRAGSEDSTVKLWSLPEGGLTECSMGVDDALADLTFSYTSIRRVDPFPAPRLLVTLLLTLLTLLLAFLLTLVLAQMLALLPAVLLTVLLALLLALLLTVLFTLLLIWLLTLLRALVSHTMAMSRTVLVPRAHSVNTQLCLVQ